MGQPFISGGNEFKRMNGVPLSKKEARSEGKDVPCLLKQNIRQNLRVKDEQEFINRGRWYNTGLSLSSQEVERRLYYTGSLIFFKLDGKFYLMDYALDGDLDYNGRYTYVHPIPIVSSSTDEKTLKKQKVLADFLSTKKFKVIYDVALEEDFLDENGNFDLEKAKDFTENSCVIIYDYTPQLSQKPTSRQVLQESIIDLQSDCIPYMRTALLNSTGVQGMKVNSEAEQSSVKIASASVDMAALNGEKWIPIVGGLDFQDLSGKGVGTIDQFLLAAQAIDNFRHSLLGIDNAGLYQKNQYISDSQNQVNAANIGLVMQDCVSQRQHACDIINSIWGLGIWYEPSEVITGMDSDMNGFLGEEQDQSGSMQGEQPQNDM